MANKYTGKLSLGQIIFIIALPIVCALLALGIGRMMISPAEVFSALTGGNVSPQIKSVVLSIRLPRILLAALVGCGLSVSGTSYQSLFSNPLATPDTLGVASGASFGAALALLLGFSSVGVQGLALVFGITAVLLTGLAGLGRTKNPTTPILAGIMVGSLFSSLVSLIKFTADTESALPAITYWLMGSFENTDYSSLLFGAIPIIVCTVILLVLRWRMNLLMLSTDEATASGVNLRALRITTEICATFITASCVSMCGQVGWVGLLVPHICRMKFGSNNVAILPASVGIGAAFMIVVDTVARSVSPREIPISVLTAIVGAPFFIYLLRKNKGWNL